MRRWGAPDAMRKRQVESNKQDEKDDDNDDGGERP